MLESPSHTARVELKNLMQEVQALFAEATSATGVKAEELRNRGLHLLDSALDQVHDLQAATFEKGKEIVEDTDGYVRANPWQAVGIAAVVGLLAGMLIARK